MIFILYTLLSIPVVVSFYFSDDHSVVWLCLSLLALAIASFFILCVSGKFQSRWFRIASAFILFELLAAFQVVRLLSFYFQGESFNDRFFFHFSIRTIIESVSAYGSLIIAAAFFLLLIPLLCWRVFSKDRSTTLSVKPFQLILLLLVFCFLEPDVSKLSLGGISSILNTEAGISVDTIAWQELGLHQRALATSINNVLPGKNLLFIYLESLEQIYTDESVFPGLTPNLNTLASTGLNFTDMRQTEGAGWTVGALVTSQCGTPLLNDFGPGGNDILQNGFLDQAICLGDVLNQAGYRQVFLGGAAKEFAGKGSFLASHGYDEVYGKAELVGSLSDPAYLSGWGLYDDSLFNVAVEEYERLAASEQPFNLTVLTVDTHHPVGEASASCPEYELIDNSILHAVRCTDFLLNSFLERINSNPAWENTVVILFSDHLAMRNVAQKYYPDGYNRKLFMIALNTGQSGNNNIPGTHMDVVATVLDLLAVQHEREFLAGKSLLNQNRQTSLAVNFDSTRRLEAIKYINSNLLSSLSSGLCESDQLISVSNNRMSIAGREVIMSISGQAVAFESLYSSHGVIAFLNEQGRVRSTLTLNLQNLPHVLYQFNNDYFLLVAPADQIPNMIRTGEEISGEVSVLLGSPKGETVYLGGSDNLETLTIETGDCNDLLSRIENSIDGSSESLMMQICLSPEATLIYEDVQTLNIYLPGVAIENNWYQAVLEKKGEDRYGVIERNLLGNIGADADTDYCHAYFGNSELIIPAMRTANGGIRAMRMQLILGENLQFRVVEI